MKFSLYLRLGAVFFTITPAIFPALTEDLPVEVFFKNPDYDSFRISPDGRTLAVLSEWGGYMNVFTFDLKTRTPQVLTNQEIDVTWVRWANNDRILYSMNQGTFERDSLEYSGGLFAVNKDGSDLDVLIYPWLQDEGGGVFARGGNKQLRFRHTYPQDEDYILVTNHRRRAEFPDLFLVNVNNTKLRRLENNPGRIQRFLVDSTGTVYGGTSFDTDTRISLFLKSDEEEDWIKFRTFDQDYHAWAPIGLNPDGNLLVSSNTGRDTRAIYELDLETKEIGKSPLMEDDDYDISGRPLQGLKSEAIIGMAYEAEKPVNRFIDPEYARIQNLIDQALPNTYNAITNVTDDGSKAIIRSISDVASPGYYLLDLDETNLEFLGSAMPWVDKLDLVEQKPIRFTADDGVEIHGYLYLPSSYSPDNPVPLIVNPHGGPWARDTWGIRWWIDMEPQYLASRGFAVLKVNFRGSTGYGKEHLTSSFKNLERMHQDVIDGVNWAVSEGFADPDKLGIMGASWGGYATMTALVKEPDMFKFGVNIFGVVDIVEHTKNYLSWDRETAYNYWIHRIGDVSDEEEVEYLEEWSPINFVSNIKAPVFIYHGVRDFNVDIEQSRMLVKELNQNDLPHTVVYRTDEAHSAFDEKNRVDLYQQLDQFLKEVTADWE